jgi:hypothetical protein
VQESPSPRPAADRASLLRFHALPLALALLFAALIVFPRWYLLWTDSPEGVRVQISPGGAYGIGWDEPLYVPGMRQAYDGTLPVRDAYLVDGQDEPPLTFAWWQEGIGLLGHATGGDIFYAFALVATAAALSGFALLYAMAFGLTRSRIAAVAVIPIALVLAQVIYQAGGFLPLRHWDTSRPLLLANPPGEFHTWYRFLAPSMPLPLFFGAVIALRSAFRERSLAWSGAAAVALALLVYTNPYFWTAVYLALGAWAVWLAWERDFASLRRLLTIAVAGALVALPEVVLLVWNAAAIPYEVKQRSGLGDLGFETKWLMPVLQRLVFLAPFGWFAWRRERSSTALYAALAIAPLALALTSGLVPQVDHYLYQAWVPMSLPLVLVGGAGIVDAAPPTARRRVLLAGGVLAIGASAYVAVFQARAMSDLDQDYALRPDEAAAIDWIRDNVGKDETVVSPSRSTNYLLASLTSAYVYVPYGSSAVGTRASDDEIVDRYFRASAVFGYTVEDTMYRLEAANGIPRPQEDDDIPAADIERYVERSMIDYLLNEIVDDPEEVARRTPGWRAEYARLLAEDDPLGSYRAKYIYCGPRERLWKGAPPVGDTWVENAFQQGEVAILQIVKSVEPGAEQFGGCYAN